MSPTPAPLNQRLRCGASVLFQEVGDEAVLLDLASETYFGLDAVGCRIWQLLADAPTLETVHAALCEEFDAPPDRIREDLLALAAELEQAGLVTLE